MIFRSVCRREVVDYREYHIYHSGRIPGPRPCCLLLLHGSSHAGEGYRLSLEGDRLEADLWTSDVYAAAELGGYCLCYKTKFGSMELRPNTLVPLGGCHHSGWKGRFWSPPVRMQWKIDPRSLSKLTWKPSKKTPTWELRTAGRFKRRPWPGCISSCNAYQPPQDGCGRTHGYQRTMAWVFK